MAKMQPEVKTSVQAIYGDQGQTFADVRTYRQERIPVIDGCVAFVMYLELRDGTKKTLVTLIEQPTISGDAPMIVDQIGMTQTEPIGKQEAINDR